MKNWICWLLVLGFVGGCRRPESQAVPEAPVIAELPGGNLAVVQTEDYGFELVIRSALPARGLRVEVRATREDNGRVLADFTQELRQPSAWFSVPDLPLNQTFAEIQVDVTSLSSPANRWSGRIRVRTQAASPLSVPDPPAFGTPFGAVPAVSDLVLYQVNQKAMSSSADLQGVINRLDHIRSLGINTIWLMPLHPVGQVRSVGSPYSIRDFGQVNPEQGTLATLRTLVAEAHSRQMAVILDWVANHTAWDHPWMRYRHWYARDASGQVIIPPGTNWQDVAELDYNDPDMRIAMIKAMKYWILAANVDGFRCDAADMVPEDFWRQATDSLRRMPGRHLILLAEGARTEHLRTGFQLNYGWDFYATLKNVFRNGQPATTLFQAHAAEYVGVPAGTHRLRFTTNHDESAWDATPVSLFGGVQGALAASVITTCMGGVPMLYSSQEVGRQATLPFFTASPIDWSQNPDMLRTYQQLFAFYNRSTALRRGNLTTFGTADIACFRRQEGSRSAWIIANTRNNGVNFVLPAALSGTAWTDALSGQPVALTTSLSLPPYGFYVLSDH